MPIRKGNVEQVRDASDIVEVVSDFFVLQKSGSAYKACCPFHKEKTASFMVNPQRQIYHCFGCGSGGDVFKFVMQYQNLEFLPAVRLLAQRAGITLELSESENRRNPVYAALERACNLYQKQFQGSPAEEFIVSQKRLKPETISQFRIGYSPQSWDFLLNHLEGDFTTQQLLDGGLIRRTQNPKSQRGVYDTFRGRVMFPIFDSLGRVVSFTARTLDEVTTENPKYINGVETEVYKKSRVLYGFNFARRAIIERNQAIVVEGAPDTLACHQGNAHGIFNNTISPCGTSFTEDHLGLLLKCDPSAEIVIVFDNDKGGMQSATRLAGRLMGRANTKIAVLPEGKDPDDILREDGNFNDYLISSRPTSYFFIDQKSNGGDRKSPEGLMGIIASVKPDLKQIPESSRDLVLQVMSEYLGITPESLSDCVFGYTPRPRPVLRKTEPEKPTEPPRDRVIYHSNSRTYHEDRMVQMLLASRSHKVLDCFLPRLEELGFNKTGLGLLKYLASNPQEPMNLGQQDSLFHQQYLQNVNAWIKENMSFTPEQDRLKALLRTTAADPRMEDLEDNYFRLVTINMGIRLHHALATKTHSLADLEELVRRVLSDMKKGGV